MTIREVDNRDLVEVEIYLKARVEVLLERIATLEAELLSAQQTINTILAGENV